jgi:hypothetical protein
LVLDILRTQSVSGGRPRADADRLRVKNSSLLPRQRAVHAGVFSLKPDPVAALREKVAFLCSTHAYPDQVQDVVCRETHMSFVFLAGDSVYKLKKPVRFPYRVPWAPSTRWSAARRPSTFQPAGKVITAR